MRSSPKMLLFQQFALVAKTLGHPLRIELIEQLGQGARTVELLAGKLGLPIANVSQHLQAMRRAGLVAAQRKGKFIEYRLATPSVLEAVGALQRVAEDNLAEVDKVVRGYFRERDSLEPVSREELQARMQEGSVTVFDVRPPDEYALGHLPRAINVPLEALESVVNASTPYQDVVAYCRGPYCVMAFEAVAKLRQRGLRAHRLEGGMPEWIAAGLPVET